MSKVKQELIDNWNEYRERIENSARVDKNEPIAEKNKRIEKAVNDYQFFCEYYFSHLVKDEEGVVVKNGKFHNEAAIKIKFNRRLKALFEWARSHAKTTHMVTIIPMWLVANSIYNKKSVRKSKEVIKSYFSNMVLVGKSEDASIASLGNLQAEFQYNEIFTHDFGDQHLKGSWMDGNFQIKAGVSFKALGRGQSPRGLNYKGKRPDYIVIDDIDDDELCLNESRVEALFKWVFTALYGTMDMGRGRFIIIGNRISKNSIVAKSANITNIYHSIVNALDKNGNITWKEKYTQEDIQEVIDTLGLIFFDQEYQNSPNTIGKVFKQMFYKKCLPWDKYVNLVCYTDPSFKNNRTSDYKATVLVGQTKNLEYHILKAFVDKVPISSMIDWFYEIEKMKPPKAVIKYWMEGKFFQGTIVEQVYAEGEKRGYLIPMKADEDDKGDKYQRIESLEPYNSNGKLFIDETERDNPHMKRLDDQFKAFGKGSSINDDAPDAVEGAISKLKKAMPEKQEYWTLGRTGLVNDKRM